MFVTALLAATLAAPVPKQKPQTCFFPHTVGTKWEYIHNGDVKKVWTKEVIEVADQDGVVRFKVAVTTDTGEKLFEWYQSKDGEVGLVKSAFGENDPPMPILKGMMKAGDEWACEWVNTNGRLETTTKLTLTVGKPEELTTPAGQFTATPVTYTYSPPSGGSFTNWFADGVGVVRQTVRGVKEQSQELKSFTPAMDAEK